MPEAAKLIHVHDILAKMEATYGVAPVMATATDGLFPEGRVVAAIGYILDGNRSPDAGRGMPPPPGGPIGRQAEFTVPVLARGAAAPYSASVTPPELHRLLRAAGHQATVTTTPGAEKWVYTPVITGYESIAFELYADGQQQIVRGAYADYEFALEGSYLQFSFAVRGIADLPTDFVLPTIDHPSHQPPKAVGLTGTIGPYTAIVRSLRGGLARVLGPRLDYNSVVGHAGFAAGRIVPTVQVGIEKVALAPTSTPTATQIDPYKMRDEAKAVALAFQAGSVQYNRCKFAAANAVVIGVEEAEDDPTALWNLTFGLYPTTIGGTDTHAWTLD